MHDLAAQSHRATAAIYIYMYMYIYQIGYVLHKIYPFILDNLSPVGDGKLIRTTNPVCGWLLVL